MIISTVSFKRRLYRLLGVCCLAVFVLTVSTVIWAKDGPPDALMKHIISTQLVYSKQCKVASLKIEHAECLIYYSAGEDAVYVVLFNEMLDVTHVILNDKQKREVILWCHPTKCA